MKHPDDERLIHFLQQHRPVPPSGKHNQEEQLMALVERRTKPRLSRWIVPGAIATSLLWGGARFLSPPLQTAKETEPLEIFLTNSWNNLLENNLSDRPTSEADSLRPQPQLVHSED
ncbi:MAG: hypothetical protein ACFB4I_24985 [Cyanophyceae cyanobacterium]